MLGGQCTASTMVFVSTEEHDESWSTPSPTRGTTLDCNNEEHSGVWFGGWVPVSPQYHSAQASPLTVASSGLTSQGKFSWFLVPEGNRYAGHGDMDTVIPPLEYIQQGRHPELV